MISRLFKTLLVVCLMLVLVACDKPDNSEVDWLLGEWHLTHNPLKDDDDVLLFLPDGQFSIKTASGKELQGLYQVQNDQLKMLIEKGPRAIETLFRVSEARDQLIFSNGAYYTKVDGNHLDTTK